MDPTDKEISARFRPIEWGDSRSERKVHTGRQDETSLFSRDGQESEVDLSEQLEAQRAFQDEILGLVREIRDRVCNQDHPEKLGPFTRLFLELGGKLK